MSKALSVAELNKRIDDLNKAAAKQGDEYQEVGLHCLRHLLASGDVGPINRLLVGMPKSTRRLAMATWAVAHGALVPNQDQGTRDTMPLRYTKEKTTNVEAAEGEKWWDSAPEREISDVFDLQVAVKALLNRAKGKKLVIGGVPKAHEGHSMLKMLAVGVGLANPFAEEEAKEAEAVAAAATDKAKKDAAASTGGDPINPGPASMPNADKPAVKREAKAQAAGKEDMRKVVPRKARTSARAK